MHFYGRLFLLSLLSSSAFAKPVYHLLPKLSNQCIEVAQGSTANGAVVDQGYCANQAYQNWTLAAVGTGIFQIQSFNGKCLDVGGSSSTPGATVDQWACVTNQKDQEWKISYQKDGYVTLTSQQSGLCLSVASASPVNGGQLQQWPCDGSPNQSFFMHNLNAIPSQGTTVTVSGLDNVAAQAAINQAKTGDTVLFPAGTYKIAAPLQLKSGIFYLGAPGAVLQSTANNEIITNRSSSGNIINNVIISGLTFNGGNVSIQGVNSSPANPANYGYNLVITDCVFENIPSTSSATTGLYLNAMRDSLIQHNTFQNNGTLIGDVVFLMYDGNDISFLYNTFINNMEGVHIYTQDASISHNYTFSHNAGTGFERMAIEYQGHGPGLRITDNTFLNWRPYAWPVGTNLAVGLSIGGLEGGYVVSNNYLDGGAALYKQSNMPVLGIEFQGTNSFVENNTITNFTQSFLIACSSGTIYQGNIISNFNTGGAYFKDGGYCGGERILVNLINGVPVEGWPSNLKAKV